MVVHSETGLLLSLFDFMNAKEMDALAARFMVIGIDLENRSLRIQHNRSVSTWGESYGQEEEGEDDGDEEVAE